ncbi:hypothetical protein NPIL_583001 [Nephila pilipes]|uniref:Uncharacterized protein n=1 Tax=Nephila pilipes TaxID=299642 RepID=A0A8X6TYV2_NEPPI|nr:hypothetical protein NPIL_583001 [Nephila pilipes]
MSMRSKPIITSHTKSSSEGLWSLKLHDAIAEGSIDVNVCTTGLCQLKLLNQYNLNEAYFYERKPGMQWYR